MTAQAGLSSTNVINQWLNTLRNAPFFVPALYGQLHTDVPGSTGTKVVSAGSASRFAVVMAAATSAAIHLHGNPPIWMNSGYNGEAVSHLSLWSQEAAGAFNANGTFYLSAPLSAPATWNANDTLALSGLTVSLGPVAGASVEGLSADLVNSWLNTFTGVGGTKSAIKQVYADLHTAHPGAAGASALSAGATTRSLVTLAAAANNAIALTGTPPAFTNSGTSETVTHVAFFDTETGATVAAPTGVSVTPSTTGGTFGAGQQFWKITATNFAGETVASSEVNATLTGQTSSAVLSWTLPDGATGVKIYRGSTTGGENKLIAKLGAVTTFTDTGAPGISATPPVSNTAKSFLFSAALPSGIPWGTAGDVITLDTGSLTISPAATSS